MADTKTYLEQDRFYHIYNHAVGNEQLFNSDNNYLFFLKLFKKYLLEYVDMYAYCLMPNHFHFIIKIKSEKEILNKSIVRGGNCPTRVQNPRRDGEASSISLLISKQFSHLFNSYSQSYNKENKRKGSLFMNRFKRKEIDNKEYLVKLIHYVHFNPVLADLSSDISEWKYSSYNVIVDNSFTSIARNQVIEMFNDKYNFVFCHKTEPEILGIE